MSKTQYQIKSNNFYINGSLTYSELEQSNESVHGLLFNARFIQGVFNDINPINKGKYDRFGKIFSKEKNTDDLIAALPEWYEAGLRAITVGLQGGGPIYTYPDWSIIDTGAFSKDGKQISSDTMVRLEKLIKACDDVGMIVIVSILYQAQVHLFENGVAILEGVRTVCNFIKELDYSNIIIEVANEHTIGQFNQHPLFRSAEGMCAIIKLAREWSGEKFAVGCSPAGGEYEQEVFDTSDVIIIHGNSLHREEYYRLVQRIQKNCKNKPILCNEDSQRITQLTVCQETHTSWGYYNNFTKQEPPTDWSITKGEDQYFAQRMKEMISGKYTVENDYFLHGFEPKLHINGGRFVRLASLYPERIDFVKYYEDDKFLYTSYAEPFLLYSLTTWEQKPYFPAKDAMKFRAEVYLHSGEIFNIESDLV